MTKANSLQTVDYNKLGVMETRILDLWASGITNQHEIVKYYNENIADSEKKIRKVRMIDVSQAIAKIKRIVLEQSIDDFREIVMEETMQLYREAKDSWLESKEDLITVTESRVEGEKGWSDTTTEKTQPQSGNPAHWANALKALESIKRLIGLDSPKNLKDVMAEEMRLILDYFETGLSPSAYEEVIRLLANYYEGLQEEVT